jgi:hypothetical protein
MAKTKEETTTFSSRFVPLSVDIKHSFITLAKEEGITFFLVPLWGKVGKLKRRETNSPSGTKKAKREEKVGKKKYCQRQYKGRKEKKLTKLWKKKTKRRVKKIFLILLHSLWGCTRGYPLRGRQYIPLLFFLPLEENNEE